MIDETIDFYFSKRHMEILIGTRCFDAIAKRIAYYVKDAMVVIDENVYCRYENIGKSLQNAGLNIVLTVLQAHENNKSMSVLNNILDRCIENNVTRKSAIIAIGGGLVGNIAGLTAGLLYRGIVLIHIPTTLMAMSDSVLSMKQAVNGLESKNIYGVFHAASFCGIDLSFLRTIPSKQLISGFIELCKNVLTFDTENLKKCLEIAANLKNRNLNMNEPTLLEDALYKQLVIMGIKAKQKILHKDPYERKAALVLEYGHTIGHALELENGGKLPHGIAVGVGMLAAAKIALNRKWLKKSEYDIHYKLLENSSSLTKIPHGITIDNLLKRIRKDNKRGYIHSGEDEYPFVLLKGIGNVYKSGSLPLTLVTEEEVLRALRDL